MQHPGFQVAFSVIPIWNYPHFHFSRRFPSFPHGISMHARWNYHLLPLIPHVPVVPGWYYHLFQWRFQKLLAISKQTGVELSRIPHVPVIFPRISWGSYVNKCEMRLMPVLIISYFMWSGGDWKLSVFKDL